MESVYNPFQSLFEAPADLHFAANKTALLVVDMQYFDAHPDWGEGRTAKEVGVAHCFDPYFEQIDAVMPKIQELLALFREKEMEVIHIRVAEWTEDSRDVGWKQLVRGLIVPSNSREADLLEAVGPQGDEIVVSKSSSGVFPVTNLDRLLRNLGIDTLVFTGTSTGGCVESAVRDAVDLNYNVVVVSDACADSTLDSHAVALGRMDGSTTYVLSTAEIRQQIQAIPNGSRAARSGTERVKPYLPEPPKTPPAADINPYSLIFPPAIDLPLSSGNLALVLIDAQRFTCDPNQGLGALAQQRQELPKFEDYYQQVARALQNMQTLLSTARRLGIPVLHVRTASHFADGRDLSRKLKSQGIVPHIGSPDADFMPTVQPQADEIVLIKRTSGIYTGTGLDELQRNLGIEHLILAGISYEGALEGSIRSATDRGYGVVLAPDACATFHPELQRKLYDLESGIIRVYPTERVIDLLTHLMDAAPA